MRKDFSSSLGSTWPKTEGSGSSIERLIPMLPKCTLWNTLSAASWLFEG